MSWLKQAVLQSNAPKHSIITTLKKNLGGIEQGRPRSELHASDVTQPSFCPRREAFLDMEGIKYARESFVPTALRVTYEMGNRTADAFIHNWAREHVIGNWWCSYCGASRSMCTRPSGACFHPGDYWQYREPHFVSKGIDGNVDVLLDVGAPKWLVVELKTINTEDFATIQSPLAEHRIRTNLYLHLIAASNSPYKNNINLHEGRVLYVSRGHGVKNPDHNGEILPFKEFVVNRNDDDLVECLGKAGQLVTYRNEGLMPSGICATAMEKTAKGCKHCMDCFSGQYPSQQPSLFPILS